MGRLRQFYDGGGVPLRIDRDLDAVGFAWSSHRNRLHSWLESLPDGEWSKPTRCELSGMGSHIPDTPFLRAGIGREA
jgi:hypothetical protein